ncbi:MAG: hypothetical protein QNJ51_21630 [Calothrix sp. MO_167.B12]|nr:hypothetical protein [Calothrix sp. MO_167.B12]
MQLFLSEELPAIGAVKRGADRITLNGILYSRGTSFSQKVQAAAEKLCRDYIQQNIKCFLVKEGSMVTLWISQPDKQLNNIQQADPLAAAKTIVSPQAEPEEKTKDKERTMTYRGKTYKANGNSQPSAEVPSESKVNTPKKRMYRGRAY